MTTPLFEQIRIREWQDSDFDTAVVLNQQAEEHIGIGSESGDWAKDMMSIDDIFYASGGEFLVGHLDENMVVMGGFKLYTRQDAEIKRMRVTPELQGRGIGPWFLGILEEDMRNIGVRYSRVGTLSVQEAALKLYNRADYTETYREELREGPEAGLTVVHFCKNLS